VLADGYDLAVDARRDHGTPQLFDAAAQAMLTMRWRPELKVDQIPAPQRIAPFAVAISAEISSGGEDLGTGRLVLLHDPDGSPSWDGDFRCVSFSRAEVDPEMVTDPLLTEVGWSWLLESLERNEAEYRAPSGTVTAVSSRSFGGIAEDPARAEVEVRASWTPVITSSDDVSAHLLAWSELLCLAAGLPPLPEGVVPITPRRSGTWQR
jgi:hypothetical protein